MRGSGGSQSSTKRVMGELTKTMRQSLPHQNMLVMRVTYMLACGVLGILLSIAVGIFVHQWHHAHLPYSCLLSFAITEATDNNVSNLLDRKVRKFEVFAQAACSSGKAPYDVRSALYAQLSKIPREVRDDIIRMAVNDYMSTTNSLQNVKTSLSTRGKAYSYMAFWSTAYNGEVTLLSAKYTTCVMVSAIEISVAEQVAGTVQTQVMRHTESEPCECGWISCAACPIFEPYIVYSPIFKRHVLTTKQEGELHRWMVKKATDEAIMIVAAHKSIGRRYSRLGQIRDDLKSFKWREPNRYLFLGNGDIHDGFEMDESEDMRNKLVYG